tara:strand:+ start:365 stop:613 length:249 start_codon:yes stop_codon:yes gene_type:complete
MISFAKVKLEWLNKGVKNQNLSVKNKIVSKLIEDEKPEEIKNTDINVLLNRVKMNQKNESRKKVYFSAAASAGLILFGLVIF